MIEFDKLQIYRGRDMEIAPGIIVTQPTLAQIEEFGEEEYWSAIHIMCATSADFKWQLDDVGIDYTGIDDFQLFLIMTHQSLKTKRKNDGLLGLMESIGIDTSGITADENDKGKNPVGLLLKDIDFADFAPYEDNDKNQLVLYNKKTDVNIDKFVFLRLTSLLRQIHGLKRNSEKPGNELTRQILIEEAREKSLTNKDKPFESSLLPLISALTVECGLCGDDKIWDMKIGAFLDNTRRAVKIQDAKALLQGAYSGMLDPKSIDTKRLDWASAL